MGIQHKRIILHALSNGYVITTKEHYEKLKKYWLDIVDVLKEETRIDLEIRWNDKK